MSGGGDRDQLELAIEAQERLRGVVPDEVIDRAVAALRRELAPPLPAPSRRQVTVVFGDVRGFTSLSERLDAERLADVMNELWAQLDDVVRARGGRIDKHIGDALMAVWGAEVAQEDDAEQAVRAALEMQAVMRGLRQQGELAMAMRVGINTGPALLGSVGTAGTEFTAMGDAVNVASRLEHLAPEDGVLISHSTYRHVRGVFDVQPPQQYSLRGKSEPVLAYVVDRAKPQAFRVLTRGVEGVETSTIGRARELDVLTSELATCNARRELRLVTVLGEAGVGKSRLLYDFRDRVELQTTPVYLFMGRAQLGQERRALGLFRDVMATRFEILQSDAPVIVADKLRQGFAPELSAGEAEITGHWLGFELAASEAVARITGSAELAAVGRAHLLTWLARRMARGPGVLVLEDVHWADHESIALVQHLTELDDIPLLVLALARPSLLERMADWPDRGGRASRIDLRPLDATACGQLVREVLKHVEELPQALVDLIVQRVDGNPFYVEEMVKMLIDDGVVAVGDGTWRVDQGRLDQARVPPTLTGVLLTRLDALPSTERIALQRASVFGRSFWDAAVAALSGGDATAPPTVDVALTRELVLRRVPSTFVGCMELIFKHALLRDVVYDTVLLRDRPGLHALAAAWLEQVAAERVSEYRETIADHLERAGLHEAAAEHMWRAGEAAAASGHHAAATRAVRRAFEHWKVNGDAPPPEAYVVLGTSLRIVGELEAAASLLEDGIDRLPAGSAAAAELYYAASVVADVRNDRDAEGALLDAARRSVRPDDRSTLAAIEVGTAWWHLDENRLEESVAAAQRALELSRGDARRSADAEAALGMAAATTDDLIAACAHAELELGFATESGDLYAVAGALGHLGVAHHLRADAGETEHYADALACDERARDLLEQLGSGPALTNVKANISQLHLRLGDHTAARDGLRGLMADDPAGSVVLHLQIEADRRITFGDAISGVQLLGRLRSHAAYGALDEIECERILSRVDLPRDDIERHLAAGVSVDLDIVIGELLAG